MENKNICIIQDNDIYVGTWDLSQGFETDHRFLKRLLEKYKSEFDEFGFIAFKRQRMTGKKGGQIDEFYLNEGQAIYLTTLLQNNSKVREFKRKLTNQFLQQRRFLMHILLQRKNAEWIEKRETGKIERRRETDTIKIFVQYATDQGSKSASKYYMQISKMENQALFFITQKFPNLREVVNCRSLESLMMADRIVEKALEEGMDLKLQYKDIYILARDRVVQFGEYIGKTPLEIAISSTNNHLKIS